MADVQSNFKTFHDKIKLSDNNENAKLRDKREIIVNALRNGLKEHAEDTGQKLTFTHFNQGSYALGTGMGLLLAFVALIRYPLDRAAHERIRRTLDQRLKETST